MRTISRFDGDNDGIFLPIFGLSSRRRTAGDGRNARWCNVSRVRTSPRGPVLKFFLPVRLTRKSPVFADRVQGPFFQ